jgi:hypothetical protein
MWRCLVLSKKSLNFLILMILITLVASSCGGADPSGTYVWIDVPQDGLSYPDVQPVKVKGHAAGRNGVVRVELYVDGDLWTAIDDPPTEDDLASFQAEWLPPGPGSYTIHAVAYGSDGTPSEYDQARITLGMETPMPVIEAVPIISITPTLTDTPTPPPVSGASIAFWADPESIDAGSCADIKWQVDEVKSVVFGGVEQPFEGSYKACLCHSETYTLTVTHLDESVEKPKVYLNVVGSCADTTPPPSPLQAVPANGLSLSCRSKQDLVWQPVSDESGISQYQVQAQRHSGDNNWKEVTGSVFGGISGKTLNLSVDCGWYFRWKVRAVDGEGNVGPWSGWWNFVVNLE